MSPTKSARQSLLPGAPTENWDRNLTRPGSLALMTMLTLQHNHLFLKLGNLASNSTLNIQNDAYSQDHHILGY